MILKGNDFDFYLLKEQHSIYLVMISLYKFYNWPWSSWRFSAKVWKIVLGK
jgi:hypothetical protein